ncbi:MAG TPA: hypothetical protein VNN80_11740 [Polyangiaceae bacterium]|nr:hypothetical protein [Polyangiaceae bacterium]
MTSNPLEYLGAAALGCVVLIACTDPFAPDAGVQTSAALEATGEDEEGEEICAASEEWLPNTPPLELFNPLPHPATECPFYRGSWQNFLVATQPDPEGRPDFLTWPSIDSLFVSTRPKAALRAELGDIRQAGGRQILIDQNNRSLYYGIHVNRAFADFVVNNGLETADGIRSANPRLFFPAGVVELKSAWQDITDAPPGEYDDYITANVLVPTLSQDGNGAIVEDKNRPREIRAALLALHVVYTQPGHPEFIWGSFEHSTSPTDISAADGSRDVAPTFFDRNPSPADPDNLMVSEVVAREDSKLYRAGTPANRANQAFAESELVLDEATQTFPGQQTSIYRMFPASKGHSIEPDAALSSLNFNVGALFATKSGVIASSDKRGSYRQVGSVWMDKPAYFRVDSPLANDLTSPLVAQGGDPELQRVAQEDLSVNGGDSEYSILAGEDRLSSTAMESFTQSPTSFPNCFSCHNTQAVTTRGIPANRDAASPVLLGPKRINVSHVFAQFLLEETQ